jgi:DNA uptake protein ComE-like DNA-binding protein
LTPTERNALLFLSALVLLGAAVRMVRARSADVYPSRAERAELSAQIAAVDSVRSRQNGNRAARGASRDSRSRRSRAGQNGSGSPGAVRSRSKTPSQPPAPVDLDVASLGEIEALPWIGPVLAERIVTNRDSLGPFGSMEQLQRVYGVGPGMARRLEGRVTFSQTPRHFRVEDRGKRTSSGARARPLARPRAP